MDDKHKEANTAQKVAELEAQLSSCRQELALLEKGNLPYRALFENDHTVMLLVDPDSSRIVDANPAACTFYGYDRQTLTDMCLTELNTLPRQELFAAIEEARRAQGRDFTFQHRRADGNVRDVEIHSGPVTVEDKTLLFSIIHDITKRRRAQEALQERQQLYSAVVKQASDGIYLLDPVSKKVLEANRALCRMLGYTPEAFSALQVYDFVSHNRREIDEIILNITRKGEDVVGERKYRHRDGRLLDVEVSANSISFAGRQVLCVVVRDITRRKQAEKESERLKLQLLQAQKMEAIGTLAGGIAHDFNNLLMGILGRTSILLMDTGPADSRHEHLKGIEEHVKNAADLTRQLLGFARGGKYDVRPIDVNALLGDQNALFARTHKEICFHEDFADNLPTVEADHGQLKQVLLNLYVNAWQAMPGGGHLFAKTKNVTLDRPFTGFCGKPGRYVKISVTDTGVGMDKATCQRIFEPFFTTREMGRGTGLGLASVYGIIQNHGGSIRVTSRKGEGATFDIYLPASEKPARPQQPRRRETMLRGSETVLLIDDEPMVAEVGAKMMARLGYQVLTAASGLEALAVYSQKHDDIDVVVLDMIMPDMNGEQTFRRLERINRNIKVIFSSGYSLNHQAMGETSCSNHPFIQKPFDIARLSRKLRKVLDS